MNRVGIGYDLHRLVAGRPLILGGVRIDYPRGLMGHSDADVVLHAVTDALLGAAGLPDIGELFPDTDPAYKDADSKELLQRAYERVKQAGYRAGNVDVIIHAERPTLGPHKVAIAASIAGLLEMPPESVGVKAKTNEGLGSIGAGEAIAATAATILIHAQED